MYTICENLLKDSVHGDWFLLLNMLLIYGICDVLGRAEALLIAAYGQQQNNSLEPSCCDTNHSFES